jgi:crotonyl-CoA carboxylase/reductase
MKAVFFEQHGGPEVLQYGEVAEPTPGPGEALVRVKAAGCNYNDLWARNGMPGLAVPLPHISGTDTVGVVEAVGAGVHDYKAGDEVMFHCIITCRTCAACTSGEEYFCRRMQIWGFTTGPMAGGFAELCVVPVANLARKPASLSWVEAATLPASGTAAWRMLVSRARIKPDDVVLVWGAASGLGAMGVQIAKCFGARVIGVTRSGPRAEYARQLGADEVIDRDHQDVEKEVARLTGRRGVDVVFEHPGQETWPVSVRALRYGGSLVVCGATSGFKAETDLRYLWNKQLNFYGSHVGTKADFLEMVRRVELGRIKPLHAEVMPLADLAEAQARLSTEHYHGKLVVVP